MYQPILCRSPIPYRWRISNRVLHRSLTSSPSLIPHLSFNHSIIIAPSLAIRLIPSRAPIHHLIPIPYPSWVIHLILYRPLIPHQSHDPLSFTHPSPHPLIFHASFTQSLLVRPSLISSPSFIAPPSFTQSLIVHPSLISSPSLIPHRILYRWPIPRQLQDPMSPHPHPSPALQPQSGQSNLVCRCI